MLREEFIDELDLAFIVNKKKIIIFIYLGSNYKMNLGYENYSIDNYRADNTPRTGVAPGMVKASS